MGCAFVVAGTPANAANFTVTSNLDDVDAVPGDGVCATPTGVCSLRAAIQETNALLGMDTINLPRGAYSLKLGELGIIDDLVILGAGPTGTTIKNVRQARVLSIASGATVSIDGVRVQRGQADSGAGLLNKGTATLSNISFSGNRAASAAFGLGGGIDNSGTLTIDNATFLANRATGSGGGFGGSIYNTGTVTGSAVTFSGNFTNGCGGAIFNDGGTLTLSGATISGNRVTNSGGGIFNQSGTVTLTAATLSRNHAKESGGGIFAYAPVTLTNVTLNANSAAIGGAIVGGSYSTITLANVTVSSNRATQGGGGLFTDTGRVTLHNTIVAFNQPKNCDGTTAVTSLGYNLDSGTSCGLVAAGDQDNSNPTLGGLHNNGGATKTCALLLGSPAINAGDNSDCPVTDQRGDPRPAGAPAVCDIGSYEMQP